MKHVHRRDGGFVVYGTWGPEKICSSFADSKWSGPLGALLAANAMAADLHLWWEKPMTSRSVMYPYWRVPESTGERAVYLTPSGLYRVRVTPHPREYETLKLPEGATLDDAVTLRNAVQNEIYKAYPIKYWQG